ncbi:hypothetical protein ABZX85_30400 [Streptomyces sp. NPDC004539]|uniref:hypothetical protein n=1 Tax=Streptomyces sp. NPDC004539 TaxID=3154280 RepID=UPI0033A74520
MSEAPKTSDLTLWPAEPFPLERERVEAAYRALRETLAAEIGHVDAAGLDGCLGPVPADATDAEGLDAWLRASHLPLEWVALRLLSEVGSGEARRELSGRVVVPEDQIRVVGGDVTVHGDLLLEDGARVVVLGDLRVTGALVASTDAYSLVAARRFECRAGVTAGSVMALDSVHCPGAFCLSSDHHDSLAPLFTGGVLVDHLFPAQFDRVEVATRVTGGIEEIDHDAALEALGLSSPWEAAAEDDEDWDDEWDDIDVGGIYAARLRESLCP